MLDERAAPAAPEPSARPPVVVVVRAAIAPMHAEARVSSPQTSQALAGHVLLVHERAGDWLRAAGIDGYPGWVHRGYLAAPSAAARWVDVDVGEPGAPWAAPGVVGLLRAENRRAGSVSLGCTVRSAAGARALPLGALVEDGAGADGEVVEAGDAVPRAALATRFPRSPGAVAASARALFAGTCYQWGGVTPWGADCSGFVQSVYRLHGVELPRDAWQQALAGAAAPERVGDLAAGDLLFFSDRDDGRITHVGAALGGSQMAHVALGRGGFAVERLDAADDPYVARLLGQWRASRRVLP